MRWKGINYDIGTVFLPGAESTRPVFDRDIVRREIDVIASDLHCTAIRISGLDVDRLAYAAECALDRGLSAWLSPILANAPADELLAYYDRCAAVAADLRRRSPDVVFVAGCELTLFMQGLIDGATFLERIQALSTPAFWRSGGAVRVSADLNAFLARAADVVRARFDGPLTYASGAWEQVDWSPFDIVGIDHYRDARNADRYVAELQAYRRFGKPVAVTEFGCCTYAGADQRGGMGWAIVDWSTDPPRLDGDYVRDEAAQARYLLELLDLFEKEQVDGAFPFTFVSPLGWTSDDPSQDRDLASYALVKTLPDGARGRTYPDLPWEPKEAFRSVGAWYAERG